MIHPDIQMPNQQRQESLISDVESAPDPELHAEGQAPDPGVPDAAPRAATTPANEDHEHDSTSLTNDSAIPLQNQTITNAASDEFKPDQAQPKQDESQDDEHHERLDGHEEEQEMVSTAGSSISTNQYRHIDPSGVGHAGGSAGYPLELDHPSMGQQHPQLYVVHPPIFPYAPPMHPNIPQAHPHQPPQPYPTPPHHVAHYPNQTMCAPPPSNMDPMLVDSPVAIAQFYEARMRDHAAAYASAAAGAAWAAAQVAKAAADFAAGTVPPPMPASAWNQHPQLTHPLPQGPAPHPYVVATSHHQQPHMYAATAATSTSMLSPAPRGMYPLLATAGSTGWPMHAVGAGIPVVGGGGGAGTPQIVHIPLTGDLGSHMSATASGALVYNSPTPSSGYYYATSSSPADPTAGAPFGEEGASGIYCTSEFSRHQQHPLPGIKKSSNLSAQNRTAVGSSTTGGLTGGGSEEDSGSRQHRRKRQQRLPPDQGSASAPRMAMVTSPLPRGPPVAPQQSLQLQQQGTQVPQQQQQGQLQQQNMRYQQPQRQQQQDPRYSRAVTAYPRPPLPQLPLSSAPARGKIRRRLRSDGESSGSERIGYNCRNAVTSTITSAVVPGSNRHDKKKARSDASLLGKTGIAALYEWCSKRQRTPIFQMLPPLSPDQFEFAVYLEDGVIWGRGRGHNKVTAKQEAARQTLRALVPGVVFDMLGLLTELPSDILADTASLSSSCSSRKSASATCMEDLAPHLAKQLAIGSEHTHSHNQLVPASGDDPNKKRQCARLPSRGAAEVDVTTFAAPEHPMHSAGPVYTKRTLDIYPGTSTTSGDEEDENAYYSGRGASVCSVLLHAMVQINPRIPDPPVYSYEPMAPRTSAGVAITTAASAAHLKRKVAWSSNNDPNVHRSESLRPAAARGSFRCTARLTLLEPVSGVRRIPRNSDDASSSLVDDDVTDVLRSVSESNNNSPATDNSPPHGAVMASSPHDDQDQDTHRMEILEATGLGATKREARHVASATLLALLFPEYETMVEVKAAAEAARERYAASKASQKQQHPKDVNITPSKTRLCDKGEIGHACSGHQGSFRSVEWDIGNLMFCGDDRPLRTALKEDLANLMGMRPQSCAISMLMAGVDEEDDEEHEERTLRDRSAAYCFRQLSRQRQVDRMVESALQAMNELDEEGRCLPSGLTADDVGRIVFRRAEPEDLDSIKKLLRRSKIKGEQNDTPSSFWSSSSSSIVLLLCRAIAAYEDPPLGCAVLTFGFSMERGRNLRLARIGTESHLPQERMMECLHEFARCMKCDLDTEDIQELRTHSRKYCLKDVRCLVDSYLLEEQPANEPAQAASQDASPTGAAFKKNERTSTTGGGGDRFVGAITSLQSVQEESDESSDSSRGVVQERIIIKQDNKSHKRSRVE